MKEISTTQKTWLQRHFPYGIAVLFLLLFAAQCVNSDRQAGVIAEQTKELEKTKKEFAQKEKDFKLLQEDLEQDSEEKQAKIDSLHKDNSNKDRLLVAGRIN